MRDPRLTPSTRRLLETHAPPSAHTGYNKNALNGPLKKLPQTGSSWYDDQTAGWKVSPFWPVKMPYLVIDKSKTALDNDAAWFVVGTSASSNVAASRHRRDASSMASRTW